MVVCARSPSTSCWRTSPSSTTASAAGACEPATTGRAARVARRRVRGLARRRHRRAGAARSGRPASARARADGAPDGGRAAHVPAEPAAPRPPARRARRPALDAGRARRVERALAEETTMLWQTDEVRSFRPARLGRGAHGPLVLRVQPVRRRRATLARRWRRSCPALPVPLRFGTWIGGDQDGNPNADGRRAADALARARALALRVYRDEVRELARALGVSDTAGRRRRGAAGLDRRATSGAAGLRRGDAAGATPPSPTAAS